MRWRWQSTIGRGLLALACSGCGSMDAAPDEFPSAPEYQFGGQTGSLVPGCGVAPLSREGQAVPAGDAIAVVYTSGCPDGSLEELASLSAADATNVGVRLEPLDTAGTFLVRADEMLAGGDYRLALANAEESTLLLSAEAAALPMRLGGLAVTGTDGACPSTLELELELTPEALAYAPLLRLWARIDGGREQLFVDYGALEVEASASSTLFELLRCGGETCLEAGAHVLELRAEIAGEQLQIETARVSFDIDCAAPSAPDSSASDSSASCSMARPQQSGHGMILLMLGLALSALRRPAARFLR